MLRLFVGLTLPNDVRFALSLLRGGISGARWMPPEDYHITLRFGGDMDERQAKIWRDDLYDIKASPMEIVIDGLDAFGGDRPRILYARVQNNKPLNELQSALERSARRLGFEPDPRRFVPHITMAKLKRVESYEIAQYLQEHPLSAPLRFQARDMCLFSAKPLVGGGPYAITERWSFKG